jgi:hypothetical protein
MKAELVFNLDEVGMSKWEDRKDKKVIVSKTMAGQTIHHRASRNVKHISIIISITAARKSVTPYIVASQDSKSFRRRLMSRGVRLGIDFVLRQQSKPYVNSTFFLEYINSILIPYFNKLRESEDFAGCEAVFLIDNCSPHMGDAISAILTRELVRVITFTTHTTHIFQVLDVVLFDAFKKHGTGLRTLEKQQPAAALLLKVWHDFKQTMMEMNTWEIFAAIGFTPEIEKNLYGLLFDEEKFRESSGFTELWERNTPLESLAKKRRELKFGWINKPK